VDIGYVLQELEMRGLEIPEADLASFGLEFPGPTVENPGSGEIQITQSAALKNNSSCAAALDMSQRTNQQADVSERPIVAQADDQLVLLAPKVEEGGHRYASICPLPPPVRPRIPHFRATKETTHCHWQL
jgi:hypothetical protein